MKPLIVNPVSLLKLVNTKVVEESFGEKMKIDPIIRNATAI